MNILIIGAGAVGKVYGRHLAKSGAKISFFVKEKYRAETLLGFDFYNLNDRNEKKEPAHWQDFEVITELSEISAKKWDSIFLTFSSTALKGEWLPAFAKTIGQSSIVTLQVGLNDRARILEFIPLSQLLTGTIPIISFDAPLDETSPQKPGTAYWIPPGSYVSLSGPSERVYPLVNAFRKSGFPVKEVKDASLEYPVASPVLMIFVAALRRSDWSFEKIKQGQTLSLASLAMKEAIQVHCKKLGIQNPGLTAHLRPFFFKLVLAASRLIVPFNLEAYLKLHFTKVGEQMEQGLEDYIQAGQSFQITVSNMEKLKHLPTP